MSELLINIHDTSLVVVFIFYLIITVFKAENVSDFNKTWVLVVFFMSAAIGVVGAIARIWI